MRNTRRRADHARPRPPPIVRAKRFFHRASANRAMQPARMARPTTAGTIRAELAWPMMATAARAMTGSPSLRKLFQMPVSVSSRVICEPVKPHERNIATARPTAMAPPPGRMFAIVVEDWLFTAACAVVRPGIAATICHQYVARLKTVATTSEENSSHVRLVIVFQTEP